jgi:hypothetical protein
MGGYSRPPTTMSCGLGYVSRTTCVCFCFMFSFFSFNDYGLSTRLNHRWDLLSSLHPRKDDDLKGVFWRTHVQTYAVV